jgi:hypothetical protein
MRRTIFKRWQKPAASLYWRKRISPSLTAMMCPAERSQNGNGPGIWKTPDEATGQGKLTAEDVTGRAFEAAPLLLMKFTGHAASMFHRNLPQCWL